MNCRYETDDWLTRTTNWCTFRATTGVGVIHHSHNKKRVVVENKRAEKSRKVFKFVTDNAIAEEILTVGLTVRAFSATAQNSLLLRLTAKRIPERAFHPPEDVISSAVKSGLEAFHKQTVNVALQLPILFSCSLLLDLVL